MSRRWDGSDFTRADARRLRAVGGMCWACGCLLARGRGTVRKRTPSGYRLERWGVYCAVCSRDNAGAIAVPAVLPLAHPRVDTEERVDKISSTGECVPGVDLPAGPSCLPEGRLDWDGAEQVLPETSGKIATSDCPGVDTEA